MSQTLVYEILRELGGKATTKEIRKFAKEKYPDRTLYNYVSDRLYKLEKWKRVKKLEGNLWEIIEKDEQKLKNGN